MRCKSASRSSICCRVGCIGAGGRVEAGVDMVREPPCSVTVSNPRRILASMAERFYVNCPLALGLVEIEGPEAHHLAAVCRIRPGQQVCLFNGDGHEYHAEVVATGKRSVTLKVLSLASPARELGFPLHVGV